MHPLFLIGMAVGTMFMAGEALAGLDVFVYPSKGQTKEQQEQDEFACYKWSKEQTGFDPTQTVQQAAPPPQHGQVVGGAARGAALGAIGGAIAGDAGKGAAIGAAVGGTAGAMRRRGQARQAEAAQAKAEEKYEASVAGYKRAFTACMTGRDYTVS
ncbi:MAG TPA: glycine zipper family protein [Nitrospira sp.]|nr:glycine zipper family protein [Nitrospira sp.]